MSDNIYICKNILNQTNRFMGKTIVSDISNDSNLATIANNLTLDNYPNIVQMHTVDVTWFHSTSVTAARSYEYGLYLKDAKLVVNNANDSSYTNTLLFQNRLKYNLHFRVYAYYYYNGINYSKPLEVVVRGDQLPSYNSKGYYNIPQFPNILTTKENATSNTINVPLSELMVNINDSTAISRVDGVPLDTLTAIELLKTVTNITTYELQGYKLKPFSSTLFTCTLPEQNGGKLFLTNFNVKELANVHCMYAYRGAINTSFPNTRFAEPSSTNFIKQQDTEYSIYEYAVKNGTPYYRNPNKFINMLSHEVNSVDSSFDDNVVHVAGFNSNNAFTLTDTGMLWSDLEKIAWFDCVFFRFTFKKNPVNPMPTDKTKTTTEWYSLAQCIKEGVDTPQSFETVDIEIALPDLCSLTYEPFDVDDYTKYSLNDLYPYNPIDITLELGYQSNYESLYSSYKTGLYVGTNKIKRLFIGKQEIESFIADDKINTLIVKGNTSKYNTDGPFPCIYRVSDVIKVNKSVKDANIISLSLNTDAEITGIEDTKIYYALYSANPNEDVTAIITYTIEGDE